MLDSSQFSTVASTYGWPIGAWCVGDVTDMTSVFSGDRNANLQSFNEDISEWDVSKVTTMNNMFGSAYVRVIKIRCRPLFCQAPI